MKNNSAKHDKSLINVLYLSIREEQSFLGYPWINYPPKSDEREKENSPPTCSFGIEVSRSQPSRDRFSSNVVENPQRCCAILKRVKVWISFREIYRDRSTIAAHHGTNHV